MVGRGSDVAARQKIVTLSTLALRIQSGDHSSRLGNRVRDVSKVAPGQQCGSKASRWTEGLI
jgi:hypothetical protein